MVTLEKIDQVVDRTGASYEEAKRALEMANGNVIEAIIIIQNDIEEKLHDKKSMRSSDIIDTLKEFIRKGNVSRIIITDDGVTLLNIPVTFGAIGMILAPVIAVIGVGTVLVTNINVSIQDSQGNIIDLNKETSERMENLKRKGQKTKETAEKKAEEFKDKVYKKTEDFKDNVEDFKDNVEDLKDNVEDNIEDFVEETSTVKEDHHKGAFNQDLNLPQDKKDI